MVSGREAGVGEPAEDWRGTVRDDDEDAATSSATDLMARDLIMLLTATVVIGCPCMGRSSVCRARSSGAAVRVRECPSRDGIFA